MFTITAHHKNGNKTIKYVIKDVDTGVLRDASKDELVGLIGKKLVTNARVQWYQGKPIIRAQGDIPVIQDSNKTPMQSSARPNQVVNHSNIKREALKSQSDIASKQAGYTINDYINDAKNVGVDFLPLSNIIVNTSTLGVKKVKTEEVALEKPAVTGATKVGEVAGKQFKLAILNGAISLIKANVNRRTIHVPLGVRTIVSGAFSECTGTQTIILPDGLNVIEDGAFDGMSQLQLIVCDSMEITKRAEQVLGNKSTDVMVVTPHFIHKLVIDYVSDKQRVKQASEEGINIVGELPSMFNGIRQASDEGIDIIGELPNAFNGPKYPVVKPTLEEMVEYQASKIPEQPAVIKSEQLERPEPTEKLSMTEGKASLSQEKMEELTDKVDQRTKEVAEQMFEGFDDIGVPYENNIVDDASMSLSEILDSINEDDIPASEPEPTPAQEPAAGDTLESLFDSVDEITEPTETTQPQNNDATSADSLEDLFKGL